MARHVERDGRRGSRAGHSSNRAPRTAGAGRGAHYGTAAVSSSSRRTSSGGGKGKGPLVFGVIIAVLVVIAAAFFINRFVLDDSASSQQKLENEGAMLTVSIPEGSSTNDIANLLEDSGLVTDSKQFVKYVKKAGSEASLKPGTYHIICGTSIEEMVQMFEMGPEVATVGIPEGSTIAKTALAVEESSNSRIKAEDFQKLAENAEAYESDYPFLKDAKSGTLEGFLFPKTYEIADSATADSMIRMMLDQYRKETESLDFSYPEKAGLNEYETVILASIIEREAAAENRATVASVFYNRLDEGMRLQSDATVAYLIDGDPKPDDLEIDSPYNTYLVDGLPVGPICSPSLESLKAACDPEKTEYLYFYFTADGKYSFSKTYDEHQGAIAED